MTGVAGQRQRLPAHLHLPVGIGHGAGLFRPTGGGQHHVGVDGGLSEEQVLHHQMLEMRQRFARVVEIGIGHRRVLTHDVHALDLVGMDRVHDLDDGFALLGRELHAPRLLIHAAGRLILHRFVIGEEHRDQAGVGRALHVVLAAQRVQPRPGPADLAGDQRQRDQAARIVGAVRMLGDAHAPEDDRTLGAGEGARNLAQRVRLDAADGRHLLRREFLDALLPGLEPLDVGLDVLLVVQFLLDDHVEHRVEHRDVSAILELHHAPGVALQRLPARIHYDKLRAALRRLLEEGRRHRMVLDRVRADHDDDFGVLALVERRRNRARAHTLEQRRDRRGVAEPRAVVDVVGAEAGAHQLLEQVGFLVRSIG